MKYLLDGKCCNKCNELKKLVLLFIVVYIYVMLDLCYVFVELGYNWNGMFDFGIYYMYS